MKSTAASLNCLLGYLQELGIFKRLHRPVGNRGSLEPAREGTTCYTGVSHDSRTTEPGDLFAAFRGLRLDSHQFIPEALERGASVVCCERTPADVSQTPFVEVTSGRRALSAASAVLHGFPSSALETIGVTGTNGKTTTTFMIARCLEAAELKTGLVGTLAYKLGSEFRPADITTPDAPLLHELLAAMLAAQVSHVVMEVSSHALSQHRTADISFSAGVITNISTDHLDVHESHEDYLEAKARLFRDLSPAGTAVYNADDPLAVLAARHTQGQAVGVGRSEAAEAHLHDGQLEFSGRLAALCGRQPGRVKLQPQLPGRHNVRNAALAATTAYLYGVPLDVIEGALSSFSGLPRRLEVIHDNSYRVIDDFAHNPGSLTAVFETVAAEQPRQVIVVYALRGSRGVRVNRDNASIIAQWVPKLNTELVIGSLSRDVVKQKDRVTPAEKEAFAEELQRNNTGFALYDSLREALQRALAEVRSGGTILLLGAQGMDAAAGVLHSIMTETGAPLSTQFELGAELTESTERMKQVHRVVYRRPENSEKKDSN